MKTKAICSFFVLFAIVAGIGATTPAAFAQTEVTITPTEGSGVPGCEDTNECWTPNTATVDVGGKVIFSNTDFAMHTFTAGTVDGAVGTPSGEFDSSFVMPDDSFEYTADTVGEIPFYCSVHTWMQGTIIVVDAQAEAEAQAAAEAEAMAAAEAEAMAAAEAEAMAVTELMVTITESAMGDGTHVYLEFSEIHVNYEMIGMQNDEEIFTIPGHAMEMTSDHHIDAVGTPESPLDIKIVSLGIGPPDAEDDWTGPTGTIDTIQIVPEFGTIAMMVLAVAIISIVAVTAKSRVVPRF